MNVTPARLAKIPEPTSSNKACEGEELPRHGGNSQSQCDHGIGRRHGIHQVGWPLAKALQECDRKHIIQATGDSLQSVLAASVNSRMMDDFDLFRPIPVGGSQTGHHAMQLSMRRHLPGHFSSITLETTVVVVKRHAAQSAQDPIEDATR